MKFTKSELDKINLATASEAALDLFERSKGEKIVLDTPDGYHIEIAGGQESESNKDSQAPAVFDKLVFNEAYQYLQNAKNRFDTKSAGGYSDCKTNCRNALISTLKALTGKENPREAARELGKQKMLGNRELDFIESFADLLAKLYGLASRKGPHPPMTREENDAAFVLNITTIIVSYITNQATKSRP